MATDFHLSYRQYGLEEREQDFYMQYEKLVDEIIKESPQIFLILGDIFDTPYPKPIAIKKFQDGLKKIRENGIRCFGIVGNHTLVQRNNFYPIDNVFSDNITILDNDFIIEDDVFIGGLNYRSKTHNIRELMDNLYENAKGCSMSVLLLHQILEKDQEIGYDFNEDELGLDRFDYVFLGHFHKRLVRYEDGTVYHYVGSLNSCNVAELKDEMMFGKGYTVFDTGNRELDMKTVERCRDYIQFNLTDDDLNNEFVDETVLSLQEYDIKPIVQLNVETNNPKDVYELTKKLEDCCLVLRHKIIKPVEDIEAPVSIDSGMMSIEGIIQSKFDEKWKADFCYELMKLLSEGDVESARELADDIYKKHYSKSKPL